MARDSAIGAYQSIEIHDVENVAFVSCAPVVPATMDNAPGDILHGAPRTTTEPCDEGDDTDVNSVPGTGHGSLTGTPA